MKKFFMERLEVNKVFALLRAFWPKEQITRERMEAWALGLAPYRYEDVRDAVLRYAREKHFFPDLCDICSRISKVSDAEREAIAAIMNEEV